MSITPARDRCRDLCPGSKSTRCVDVKGHSGNHRGVADISRGPRRGTYRVSWRLLRSAAE